MHGHASATAVYDAAGASLESERPLCVLYVGDFDPSGMHMSEIDLLERIGRYGGFAVAGHCGSSSRRARYPKAQN
jgi:hypothetical protein